MQGPPNGGSKKRVQGGKKKEQTQTASIRLWVPRGAARSVIEGLSGQGNKRDAHKKRGKIVLIKLAISTSW